MTAKSPLRKVPAMLKTSPEAVWRGVVFLLLLGGLLGAPAELRAAEKPYVESTPARGFHLFLRPKKKTPAAQWEHV